MIFPWRPSETVALAAVVTRAASGFEFNPLIPAWFIPSGGASKPASCALIPDHESAWRTRSVHLSRDRAPDDSATAIYEHVWFSSAPVPS
jgi:protein-L-isoaspartate(D-aspartate) O-methyltransferase